MCKKTMTHPSEAVRIGIAGSIANCVCECVFHIVDTVNIRSKVGDTASRQSSFQFVRQIYKKEGVYGFGRGFSACFYGSIFCGFSYFFLYKNCKKWIYENFGVETSPSIVAAASSVVAEMFTLLVHFPYDLVKCRL